jgi:hypothetical protein
MAFLSLTEIAAAVCAVAVAFSVSGCANAADDTLTGLVPVEFGVPDGGDGGNPDSGAVRDTGVRAIDSATPATDSSPPPPACPPASTAGFTPPPYVGALPNQGDCTAVEISEFIAACGDGTSSTTCEGWAESNVDGDAATRCGKCILAKDNNGGVWRDPKGYAYPNYAACIQITDPINGAACAAAYDHATACDGVACDMCSAADFSGCVQAAAAGECNSLVVAQEAACATDFADGGAAQICSPGAATMTRNPDYTYIITLICGGGDGG